MENEEIYAGLNKDQRRAVNAVKGRIRVIAGAGSGKTRTLVLRFAHLIGDLGVPPTSILCITFTNKAAHEMQTRIEKYVGADGANGSICTIHSFCVRFLREEIYRIGYPKNFNIIGDQEQKAMGQEVLKQLRLGRSKITIGQWQSQVSAYKNELGPRYISQQILPDSPKPHLPAEVRQYLRSQLKSFSLDFDDLLYFTLYILYRFPDVQEKWQDRFDYIMVDEAQDCAKRDWEIISILGRKHGNIFVVGDPDQCIYEWRGAEPGLFMSWRADTDIILSQNYRSTPNILGVANSVIAKNKKRVPKDLHTDQPESCKAVYFHGKTDAAEGEWVCRRIQKLAKDGGRYSDCMVLFRARHQRRSIEQALIQAGLPYSVWGEKRFFDQNEIRDALAYLKLVDHDDDFSLMRIINKPSRGLTKPFLRILQEWARLDGLSLYGSLKKHIGNEFRDFAGAKEFVAAIEYARKFKDKRSVSELLDIVLDESRYKKELQRDSDDSRLSNIKSLMDSIRESERRNTGLDLAAYLQDVALFTDLEQEDTEDTVKLATIHQAKGLEYPNVFLIGLTEGTFPSHRSILEHKEAGLEEERRLMYVAVTRAKSRLFLSDSEGYNAEMDGEKVPSRFLLEIKEGLLDKKARIPNDLILQTQALARTNNYRGYRRHTVRVFFHGIRRVGRILGF